MQQQIENPKITTVDISSIFAGDTVVIDGQLKTVTSKDIKLDPFMGKSIFGSTYFGNGRKIQRASYYNWSTRTYQ